MADGQWLTLVSEAVCSLQKRPFFLLESLVDKASQSVDEFEKTNSVNSSQLSGVRSWLQSSGDGKKEQDMS